MFIYHDKVRRTAKAHRSECGACRNGVGMHGHQVRAQNEWYGPFATLAVATATFRLLGHELPVTLCRRCRPGEANAG